MGSGGLLAIGHIKNLCGALQARDEIHVLWLLMSDVTSRPNVECCYSFELWRHARAAG